MKRSKKDIEQLREAVQGSGGDLRLHIQWSRSGLTTKVRLWHPDGEVIGSASGGGYDKEGAAVGEAIALLFGPELAALSDRYMHYVRYFANDGRSRDSLPGEQAQYGLTRYVRDGKTTTVLDGACGIREMEKVFLLLGYARVERYSTGNSSNILLASGRVSQPKAVRSC